MTVIENLFVMQVTMLVLLFSGYVLRKRAVMSGAFRKALTDFIINFILPCNIIKSFLIDFNAQILRDCMAILLVSCGTQLFSLLLARGMYSRAPDGKRQPLLYATQVSNAGFLGSPIVEGLYGAQGLLYASVYLIPQRIMMWSLGVTCFSGSRGKGVLKKVVTHPCIVAVAIGLALMLTQLQLPRWIENPLGMVGGCNTALSLIVIGGVLGELDPKRVVNLQALLYCGVRLILIPAVVMGGCLLLRLEPLVVQSAVVLAGMPGPLTTAMLASQYGKDEEFAVSLIFLSTLASMVTIPMLCLAMMGGLAG